MLSSSRLPANARRHAIVEAVKRAFADKGFDGTTTRELAAAAGVSEALLYKHFPSKDALYAAMRDACTREPGFVAYRRVMELQPSTLTLVVVMHFLIAHFVECKPGDANHVMHRLLARSLLEDGKFTRLVFKQFAGAWIRKVEACLRAAAKAGDLRAVPIRHDLRAWFAHHVGLGLMLHLQPKLPPIAYRARKQKLIAQAVWFILLGLGVRAEAIRRHYNAGAVLLAAGAPDGP